MILYVIVSMIGLTKQTFICLYVQYSPTDGFSHIKILLLPIGNLRSFKITTKVLMTSGHLDFNMEEGLEVQHCSFKAWGKTYQFRLWDVTFRVTAIFSPNITFCFYWRMCCLQSTKSIDWIYLLDICCYILHENKYWKKYYQYW